MTTMNELPEGFVYLEDIDSTIIQEIKYFTTDNFVGRPIKGYEAPRCILTKETALALKSLQEELRYQALGLKVFDAYRPQMAVDDFIAWSKDIKDQKMKKSFYPDVNKADFFKLNYLAEKSGHTRGSTVDLTIVRLLDKKEMDMGTPFDFMDELSHPFSKEVDASVRNNRLYFRDQMLEAGFVGVDTEWWHFTLKNEPFPETYFNFPVK